MENQISFDSFVNFWKIPTKYIWFNKERTNFDSTGITINSPPHDSRSKPVICHWDGANLFAPIVGCYENVTDLSSLIEIDQTKSTISLPFNVDSAIFNLLAERYVNGETGHNLFSSIRPLYYQLKPIIPRYFQVKLRQKSVNRMSHRKIPKWPIDLSVEIIHRNIMRKVLEVNSNLPVPMISFWPGGSDFCFLLSHDIETAEGIKNIKNIIDIEQRYEFKSVWNFVPEKYPINHYLLNNLQELGFEIGIHGLNHDGRLFSSHEIFQKRAIKINEYLRQWKSVGFRSPSNLRNLDWISKHLSLTYDTSCLSSEWYGAQPGGSCTVFPFIYNNLVEMPITLQQDFTLLEILRLSEEETLAHWLETIKAIKNVNGLVLINVHPDYLQSPIRLDLYEHFLLEMKKNSNYWHALPKEAASWWNDRNNSELLLSGNGWSIDGPATNRGVVMHTSLSEGKLCIYR